jgi:hypothetical protein
LNHGREHIEVVSHRADVQLPSGDEGTTVAARVRVDGLLRDFTAAMLGGWLSGLVIAGVLGRLVMRIIASESSPLVQGMLTDDAAPVGGISLSGSLVLALIGAFAGAVAALGYLLALRILPASNRMRSLLMALFGATVGGAILVHTYDSFDYSQHDPVWFAVVSFIALPALFGLVLPTVVDTLDGPDGWIPTRAPLVLLVVLALALSGPAIFITAPAFALAVLVQSVEPLRRLWSSRFATIAGTAIFSILIVLGTLDLAVDISSIRAEEPRSCPVCLND